MSRHLPQFAVPLGQTWSCGPPALQGTELRTALLQRHRCLVRLGEAASMTKGGSTYDIS
jgi:hypothetical protein